MWYPSWEINQQNRICFVQVDGSYTEISGLGVAWNLFISKAGGIFNPSAGTKAEIGNGWYTYLSTAAEADTIGPVSIYVVSAPVKTIQQNLEYVVQQRNVNCHSFTYTLINSVTLLPVESAKIWITTDLAGLNTIWNGFTDVFGIARDNGGYLPCLDSGVYAVWAKKAGGAANNWPDIETV
jgi:hypothetical protein